MKNPFSITKIHDVNCASTILYRTCSEAWPLNGSKADSGSTQRHAPSAVECVNHRDRRRSNPESCDRWADRRDSRLLRDVSDTTANRCPQPCPDVAAGWWGKKTDSDGGERGSRHEQKMPPLTWGNYDKT